MPRQDPTLVLFTHRPNGWNTNASIASSMQSLETSFFLIALGRYPHALSICANSIESAIQGAGVGKKKDMLQTLIAEAAKKSSQIDKFCKDNDYINTFRKARNDITHKGFSPADDGFSVGLYIDQGLPMLDLCYQELHGFNLRDSLLPEYVEHLRVAERAHAKAKMIPNVDVSYCFKSFAHLLRWSLRQNFSTSWEVDALTHADEIGIKYESIKAERDRLLGSIGTDWSFDCPLCDGDDSVIVELDKAKLNTGDVIPSRMACTECGFVANKHQPFLCEILLEPQIISATQRILEEFGITK